MSDSPHNVYTDVARAQAYAGLGFAGTYYLAFRDLPELLARHADGSRALDFGCGAGRSTRFLQSLGFQTVGVDVSPAMLEHARMRDPDGEYLQVPDGDLSPLGAARFDLVFCAYPFDNIAGIAKRTSLLRQFRDRLLPAGRVVNLVSAPELYHHDWLSLSASEFPGNRDARSGSHVRVTIREGADQRPVDDLYWTDEDYQGLYAGAGLRLLETHRPLGRPGDPYDWPLEGRISPWVIYVLKDSG